MRREAVVEHLSGALWALPTLAVAVSLVAGSVLSHIELPQDSWASSLLFQGTADDARALLIGISSTLVTVIALVLGLSVVALQLASTQYSPRILRNFLRDRVNQVVLSVFVATFTYSTAGLYTVGVSAGRRTDQYPQLAVTGALMLLFGSLLMLVFFVHHLSHSIQIDEIMARIERITMHVIEHDLPEDGVTSQPLPDPPKWAVPLPAYRSGYVQTIHPESLLGPASASGTTVSVGPMVGEHVIDGGPLGWAWKPQEGDSPPDQSEWKQPIWEAVRIGFERTAEQDVAFGVRQLADIAVKALSPAINDPYTAIQALEHLSVVLAALAGRPLGGQILRDADGAERVLIHGRDLPYFLDLACGQIRRYGRAEPRVLRALVRVLRSTGQYCVSAAARAQVAREVRLVLADAEAGVAQVEDLAPVRSYGDDVLRELASYERSDLTT